MNIIELIAGSVIVTAAAAALVLYPNAPQPKPKPEPVPTESQQTPVEQVLVPPATARAEPLPPKTEKDRLDELEKDVNGIAVEQKAIVEQVKALTEEVRGKK